MTDAASRLHAVTHQLPPQVRLLAVSKTFGPDAVQAVWQAWRDGGGQPAFGENYVQEAVGKITALAKLKPDIEWHLIGPLQSNKTALVAEHFDWVQTVDRLKIAQRLNDQRPAHLPPLNVCIQVNVDGGQNKSGLTSPEATLELALQIAALPRLKLRGLLAIPEPQPNKAQQQAVLARVKSVFDYLNAHLPPNQQLDTLSMGMSADFEAAIDAGSTMVRLGSLIFGSRILGSGKSKAHGK
jgi:pyridoxal phosphate enzyme (YggS family)